eukprot:Nk52_evm90s914 gene=Nk52_evmTU90s914
MRGEGTRRKPIIAHIDLDCFYCEVEQVRLGIPRTKPLAVQQWQGLIAVNYPARACGITRHMNVAQARAACKDLICVHVATYSGTDPEPRYHDRPGKETHKVSLDPYRKASREIFKILKEYTQEVEKASVDEAFLDITDMVDELMQFSVDVPNALNWDGLGELFIRGKTEDEQVCCYEGALDDTFRLYLGAKLVKEIRTKVCSVLGYQCSAGISHNKLLSKMGSGYKKPNNQTVIGSAGVFSFVKDFPIAKIPSFGGKMGQQVVAALGVETVEDAWGYSKDEVIQKMNSANAEWVFDRIHGVDDSEICKKDKNKSMMSAKSFRPVYNDSRVRYWLGILSNELLYRLSCELEDGRVAKSYELHVVCKGGKKASRTFTCKDIYWKNLSDRDKLCEEAFKIFKKVDNCYPCTFLAIKASNFIDAPCSGVLSSFLQRKHTLASTEKRNLDVDNNVSDLTATSAPFSGSHLKKSLQNNVDIIGFFSKTASDCKKKRSSKPTQSIKSFVDSVALDDYSSFQNSQACVSSGKTLSSEQARLFEDDDSSDEKLPPFNICKRNVSPEIETVVKETENCKQSKVHEENGDFNSPQDQFSLYRCDKCGDSFLKMQKQEHDDYHLALELHTQFSGNSVVRDAVQEIDPPVTPSRNQKRQKTDGFAI